MTSSKGKPRNMFIHINLVGFIISWLLEVNPAAESLRGKIRTIQRKRFWVAEINAQKASVMLHETHKAIKMLPWMEKP